MYEKVRSAKTKRDWMLAVMITAAVVLLVITAVPIVSSMRLLYNFHGFTEQLAESFVYGEHGGCLTASFGGETWTVDTRGSGRLYEVIVQNGAGRPKEKMPDTESLLLDFGDGSSLRIFDVPFDGAARKSDTGVLFWYERADGTHYAYDTDGLQFKNLLSFVR